MKLNIDNIDILLDNLEQKIALQFIEEYNNLVTLAVLLGYTPSFGYNSTSGTMHVYFGYRKYTLSLHFDRDFQFQRYSVYDYSDQKTKLQSVKNEDFFKTFNLLKEKL